MCLSSCQDSSLSSRRQAYRHFLSACACTERTNSTKTTVRRLSLQTSLNDNVDTCRLIRNEVSRFRSDCLPAIKSFCSGAPVCRASSYAGRWFFKDHRVAISLSAFGEYKISNDMLSAYLFRLALDTGAMDEFNKNALRSPVQLLTKCKDPPRIWFNTVVSFRYA